MVCSGGALETAQLPRLYRKSGARDQGSLRHSVTFLGVGGEGTKKGGGALKQNGTEVRMSFQNSSVRLFN